MIKQRLPDDGDGYDDAYNAGWNACYAAMLTDMAIMLTDMTALDVDMLGNPLVPKTERVNRKGRFLDCPASNDTKSKQAIATVPSH